MSKPPNFGIYIRRFVNEFSCDKKQAASLAKFVQFRFQSIFFCLFMADVFDIEVENLLLFFFNKLFMIKSLYKAEYQNKYTVFWLYLLK